MNDNIQDAKLKAAKAAVEPARQAIDFVFDSLANVTEHSKIPESLFKSEFLPYFRGDRDVGNGNNIITTWVGIAGTPMSEVDVVDDSTGEKLFAVPALFDTNILNLKNRTADDSIFKTVSVYNAESNNIPQIATNNLIKALGKRSEKLLTGEVTGVTQKRWEDILERYRTDGGKKAKKAEAAKTLGSTDDDVVYE